MLLAEPENLPRQLVQIQPRAAAVDDPKQILSVHLEYDKLHLTQQNHYVQTP